MPHWVSDHQGIEKSPPSGWEAVRHEKDGRRAWVVPLGESVNHEGTTAPSVIDAIRRLSEKQDAGTRAWLPILDLIEEVGEPPSAVVEPQKHSLDSLISAYRQVTSLEAAKFALGIVDALIELGNLSPGTQHGDLRTDRIYLAPGKDGKPDFSLPRLGPPVGRVNRLGRARSDAQALGQILAALLTQDRKTSHLDKDNLKLKHHVPTALRERWITLVNDLLDGDYNRDAWGRLRNDLSSLQSAGRGSLKLIAYAVIAFLVLGGMTASLLRTPPKVPSVELRGIVSGKTYQVSDNIKLTAEVNRRGHAISRVEFWNDNTRLTISTKAPYEYVVTQSGELRLYAVAIFQNGVSNIKSAPVTATFRIAPTTDPAPITDILIDERLWQNLTNIVAENTKAFDTKYVWWSTKRGERPKQSETNDLLGFINSTGWVTFIDSNVLLNSDITNYLTKYHDDKKITTIDSLDELQQIAKRRLSTKTNLLLLIKSRDQCLNNATQVMTNQVEAIRGELLTALTNRLVLLQKEALENGKLNADTNCCDVDFADITNSLELMPANATNTYFKPLVAKMGNLEFKWAAIASNFNTDIRTQYQANSQLINSIFVDLNAVKSQHNFLTSFPDPLKTLGPIANRLGQLDRVLNSMTNLLTWATNTGRLRTNRFENKEIERALSDLISPETASWEKSTNAVAGSWVDYVEVKLAPFWKGVSADIASNVLNQHLSVVNAVEAAFIPIETTIEECCGVKLWQTSLSWLTRFISSGPKLDDHGWFKNVVGVSVPDGLTNSWTYYTNWPFLAEDIAKLEDDIAANSLAVSSGYSRRYERLSGEHSKTGEAINQSRTSEAWREAKRKLGLIEGKINELKAKEEARQSNVRLSINNSFIMITSDEFIKLITKDYRFEKNEAGEWGLRTAARTEPEFQRVFQDTEALRKQFENFKAQIRDGTQSMSIAVRKGWDEAFSLMDKIVLTSSQLSKGAPK